MKIPLPKIGSEWSRSLFSDDRKIHVIRITGIRKKRRLVQKIWIQYEYVGEQSMGEMSPEHWQSEVQDHKLRPAKNGIERALDKIKG